MAGKKRRKKKGIRLKHIIYFALMLYVAGIFINQKKMMDEKLAKKVKLEKEIESLEKDIAVLEKDLGNSDSLEFLEKVAREELGMVKPREIVYIDVEKFKDSIYNFFNR